jgi:hypothetical protein
MRGKANPTKWLLCVLLLMAAARAEAAGRVIYVDADAAGPSDGTSWAAGYQSLQDALAGAQAGDEIRVASGIYKPDQGAGRIPGDRTATFQMADGVAIKGGYAGLGEPDPNARDFSLYPTILSGDLNGDDGPSFAGNSENSYHVVTGSGTDATAVLDGFTISGGDANGPHYYGGSGEEEPPNRDAAVPANAVGPSSGDSGGGMYNDNGSPTLIHCTFTGNTAKIGGGMINENGSSPRLTDCLFTQNSAGYGGGGMSNDQSDPILNRCAFERNSTYYGGGMYSVSSSPTVTDCAFSGNSAGDYGGGMYSSGSSPVVTNGTFTGNHAGSYGAGMSFNGGEPFLANCTFAGNKAPNGNALAFNGWGRSTVELTNCILWDGGNEIRNYNASTITISYSNVQGDWPGQGNIDVDPLFAASGYWIPNGTPQDTSDDVWVEGDYHLQSQSGRWDGDAQTWVQDQVSSPCIDAGDPFSPIGYEPFPNGGRVNMGAYGGTEQASLSLNEPNSIGVLAPASNPSPADQGIDAPVFPKLSWTPDPNAVLHHVYFGTDVLPPFASSEAETVFSPGRLAPYTSYYWRVDELDDQARKTIGPVWTFVTGPPPLEAYDPYPVDGATVVSLHPILNWAPGFNSISHDVYFGTTDPPPFVRNQTETEFDPRALDIGATYCWRIGEISTAGTALGQVWTFTTTGTPPPPKGRSCFTAETGVWLDGTLVPISKATVGRQAGRAAGDFSSSLPYLGEVETVQAHKGTFACYDVLLESGNRIRVAENHYFMADSGQWISLQDLKAGTKLKTSKGSISVTAVVKSAVPYAGEVYNLKVNGSDRYLVSQDAIIVRDY